MRFTITGADRQSGRDAKVTLAAATAEEAERIASKQGILVAAVRPDPGEDDALPLWDEEHAGDEQPQPGLPAELLGTLPAQERPAPAASPASGQYHVIMNPALYLLESAVTKHMKEGWEPLGGIQVSNWNNQLQFYQALVRKPQGGEA